MTAADLSRAEHAVVFYADSEFADVVGSYLSEAIQAGGVAIIVAAPDHRLWVNAKLARSGIDLAAAQASGSYVVIDAVWLLSTFMIGSRPDPAAFWAAVRPLLGQVTARHGPVAVFGEMVWLLWDAGLDGAAIELEALWNELLAQYQFTLLCGYPALAVSAPELADSVLQVCAAHSAIWGEPGLTAGTSARRVQVALHSGAYLP